MPTVILHMAKANPLFCFMANTPSPQNKVHNGGILFYNTIQPLLTSLDSDLNLCYLDECLLVAQLMWSPPMFLR